MNCTSIWTLGCVGLAASCAHGIDADMSLIDNGAGGAAVAGAAGWPGTGGTLDGAGGIAGGSGVGGHAGTAGTVGNAGSTGAAGSAAAGGNAGLGGNGGVGGNAGAAGQGGAGGLGAGGTAGIGGSAGAAGFDAGGGGSRGMGGAKADAGALCGSPIAPKSSWVATANVNGTTAPLAVDSDITTRYTTGKSQAGGEWLQVDFGASATINQVTLDTSNNNDYPTHWQVRLSGTSMNLSAAIVIEGDGSSPNIVVRFTAPHTGRYLLVSQTGVNANNWWSLHDLSVSCL